VAVRNGTNELYADRQVALEVNNLHPGWGPGVTLAIDFGDGSPLAYTSADLLRQDPLLVHQYERPKRFTVRVIATEHSQAGSTELGGDVLGLGEANVGIALSPVSAAREFADTFLNLRFFLAMAIGLVVQSWRFYAQQPFGAQSRDYAEALAWGVGIDAGVRGLAEFLTKIGLPN